MFSEPTESKSVTTSQPEPSPLANYVRVGMSIFFIVGITVLVVPAFGLKLYELKRVFEDDASGLFAATPLINYGLACLGFLCMLVWATMNGMFHDIEKPKETMLDQERMLDEFQKRKMTSTKPL
jgi:hypothetical protein